MDEVSFALEEDKKVIPVLLEECDISVSTSTATAGRLQKRLPGGHDQLGFKRLVSLKRSQIN